MSRNRTSYIITTPKGESLLAEFRWTVSRGRDSYGYNICSLYIDGNKVSNCDGGGYDMQGTCLADWLQEAEQDGLKHLKASTYYGLFFYNPKTKKRQKRYSPGCSISLDGGCGFSSIERIGNRLGYKFQYKG